MHNKVIIKGNKYGITIVLAPDIDFAEIVDELKIRLKNAESFFDSSRQIAVSFEGRELNNEELDKLLSVIDSESQLNIQYVLDENSDREELFYKAFENETNTGNENNNENDNNNENIGYDVATEDIVSDNVFNSTSDETTNNSTPSTGMFFKGTLRSGQKLEAANSIVIIGDVNPGASVVAGGNIVIIGSLTGTVHAGANGNRNCFVIALSMSPIQIQIADIIARSSDKKNLDKKSIERLFDKKSNDKKTHKQEAMIASVITDHIYVENISKSALQDIII